MDRCMAEKLENFYHRHKLGFFLALIAGVVVHFGMYAYELVNPDALWVGKIYTAGWEVELGRWALPLVDWMHGGLSSPILMTAIVLICFSLAGVLITELFEVEHKADRMLIPALLTVSPLVSITITYYYCSDAYAISFLLSALAVYLSTRIKHPVVAILSGAICIMFSLGIYQSNLGVAMFLCASGLMFCALKQAERWEMFLARGIRYITMGLSGVVGYFIVLKASLFIQKRSMQSFKGADQVGIINSIRNLPNSIQNAYLDFWEFFAGERIMANSYGVRILYVGLFLVFLIAIIRLLVRIRQHKWNIVTILMILVLCPVLCNIIDVANPAVQVGLLTSGGMTIVIPVMLAFTSACYAEPGGKAPKCAMQIAVIFMATCLLWGYALINNTDAMVMKVTREQTVALANRICSDLENNEFYLGGGQIMLAGTPEHGNYKLPTLTDGPINEHATWGLFWGDSTAQYSWSQVYKYFLGISPNWCSQERYTEITRTDQFKAMPCYPQEGSIVVIEDILVVKVSDIYW